MRKGKYVVEPYDFNDCFPWEEFRFRFLVNKESFRFLYNEYRIEFICKADTYIVRIITPFGSDKKEYARPIEAIEDFRLNGKTLREIWSKLI